MKRVRGVLRTRLTLTLLATAAAAALMVTAALWVSDTYIEDAVVRDLIENELAVLLDTPRVDEAGTRIAANLRFYRGGAAPARLRDYAPGYHSEVELEGRTYMLLVRDVATGDRVYLAYDATFVEEREEALAMTTAVLLILGLGLSALVARRIAQRLLRPLYALVQQIQDLDPERRGQRLSLPYVESELSVFVDAMNQHMHRLDELVERERAFAAAASHELRTPLAVIRGAAETLALSGDTAPLARIERAVRDAVQQLDALLALSRLREAPAADRVSMPAFLQRIAEAHVAAGAGRAAIIWTTAPPFDLIVPAGALAVVFGNLMRNALRAAGGGTVRVVVERNRVEVRDDGPGIPEDELPHVFEPRFRGRDGGTGMGLYIARLLADRFGWNLTLANDPRGGVVARLQLADVQDVVT